jgi:MFS superfamily sulfate permease-like transporter
MIFVSVSCVFLVEFWRWIRRYPETHPAVLVMMVRGELSTLISVWPGLRIPAAGAPASGYSAVRVPTAPPSKVLAMTV